MAQPTAAAAEKTAKAAQAAVDKAQAAAKKAREAAAVAKKAAAAKEKAAKAEAKKKFMAEAKAKKAKETADKKEAAAKAKVEAAKAKEEAKAKALLPVVLTGQNIDLTEQVNANLDLIIASGNAMIETALQSGKMLTTLKAAVKKAEGSWEVWMDKNLRLSARQAQKYMKLASDPKAVKKLLEEMGEDATINAIVNKIGQAALTNDEVKEREEKKEKAAVAKAEAASKVAISFMAILGRVDTMSLEELQELKAYVQDTIDAELSKPAAEDESDDDIFEDVPEGDDAEDIADVIG